MLVKARHVKGLCLFWGADAAVVTRVAPYMLLPVSRWCTQSTGTKGRACTTCAVGNGPSIGGRRVVLLLLWVLNVCHGKIWFV